MIFNVRAKTQSKLGNDGLNEAQSSTKSNSNENKMEDKKDKTTSTSFSSLLGQYGSDSDSSWCVFPVISISNWYIFSLICKKWCWLQGGILREVLL